MKSINDLVFFYRTKIKYWNTLPKYYKANYIEFSNKNIEIKRLPQ